MPYLGPPAVLQFDLAAVEIVPSSPVIWTSVDKLLNPGCSLWIHSPAATVGEKAITEITVTRITIRTITTVKITITKKQLQLLKKKL